MPVAAILAIKIIRIVIPPSITHQLRFTERKNGRPMACFRGREEAIGSPQ
jgi:hypothetical protein